jgi:NADH-quinone oxidoreductase subunit M
MFNIFNYIFIGIILGFLLPVFLPDQGKLRCISFLLSIFIFLISLIIWFKWQNLIIFEESNSIFFFTSKWSDFYNICFSFTIDGLSLFFVILTTFLIPLSILGGFSFFKYSFKEYIFIIFTVEIMLLNFFLVNDLFFFYIFFEGILLPLFIIIGCFGSRQRRIHASFQLFFYTLIGSFFMLFNIFYIFLQKGSTDFFILKISTFPIFFQIILWLFFFIPLSVKIPLFPFHIWLPEAHVEAPTIGSVILAGILLKMGTYGLLRFVLPVLPFANWYFSILIQVLTFLSIFYISVVTLCQIDLKKLIAYSSVAHMGFATISLFVFNIEGLISSIFLMLNHGLVSSLLFFMIGILYDRYKTRIYYYYQGLARIMPIFATVSFIAMVANIGFPGTSSFIAEFLIMFSFISFNKILAILNGSGLFFSAVYSFWIYNRIFYGISSNFFKYFSDISFREFFLVFPFIFFILFFGIFPNFILKILYLFSESILQFFVLNFF